jgi:hypothetical protein
VRPDPDPRPALRIRPRPRVTEGLTVVYLAIIGITWAVVLRRGTTVETTAEEVPAAT